VVLGWDSATFDVADPLMAEGRLPVLADLTRRGFRAGLRSTWPPMTDCAWTSAFTGMNPGAHGIFGSWYRAPGAYECRYFSSRDRRAPALWEMADGPRFAVWNVPMTYPPAPVNGAMVAGYGAPPGTDFCRPPDLQDRLAQRWAVDDLLDRAPHGDLHSFLGDLLRGVRAQAEAVVWLAGHVGADCVVAVWPHVDRAQHFFWRFRNTSDPLAAAVDAVYEAMDSATGMVTEAFPDADVVVVSDHGAGKLHADVNVGAWLAGRGYAAPARRRRSPAGLAWRLPPRIRKLGRRLAPGVARRAVGRSLSDQLGPFDWSRTQAFLGVHGDLWVNLEGREPAGTVAPARAAEILDELEEGLAQITDPRTGGRVFESVLRRDEIYSGPAAALAPDAVLDSWSRGYRVSPGRDPAGEVVAAPSPLAGVNEPWSSDHRPVGVFAAAGPRIARGEAADLSLYDVCATALALLEQKVPQGLDGRVVAEAVDGGWLRRHPVRVGGRAEARVAGGGYSGDEAAEVAAHLRDLGYIE
jgi:predicted AlkP superfamily phosphohydrolase/phosphomutase